MLDKEGMQLFIGRDILMRAIQMTVNLFIKVHGCDSEGRMPDGCGVGGIRTGRIARPEFEDGVLKENNDDPSTSRAILK